VSRARRCSPPGLCVVAGEITTTAYVDIPKIARETIKGIGYDNALYGFDGNTCGVIVSIDEQSPDIAQGVDTSEELRGGKAARTSSTSRVPATRA
jgi:S-adenosylmethionine synthetase